LKLADAEAEKQITLRHLLNHTSGLDGERDEDYGNGDDALSKAIAEFHALRQVTRPGSYWFYNNNGYSLAACILENILKKPFETIMRETFFAPLNLGHSFYFAQDAITYSCAVGHIPDVENKFRVARPFSIPRWSNAAGGIIANVEDVLRFARLHLNGGRLDDGSLLSSKMVSQMQEISVEAFGMGDFWGLGWRIEEFQEGLVYGHGGTTNGFRSQLMFSPEHQFAMTVVNNGSHSAINKEIANLAFAQYCGLTRKKYEPYPLKLSELVDFNGTYQMPGITCKIECAEGKLILSFTPAIAPPVTLIPISDKKFIISDGDYKDTLVDFARTEKGEITYLRFVAYLLERQN
jgi:CubicO group peptidase (beta-lactamase class C family)